MKDHYVFQSDNVRRVNPFEFERVIILGEDKVTKQNWRIFLKKELNRMVGNLNREERRTLLVCRYFYGKNNVQDSKFKSG